MKDLRIDLGCGAKKRQGTIGVDKAAAPGVDHVVDFEKEPLPFPDQSVQYVHLSHCMEHIVDPVKLFVEITRVCQNGAKLDVWGPYGWENSAFIYDHRNFFNEDHFFHPCVWFPDFWREILHARWLLHGFTYVVPEDVLREIEREKVSLAFALRYFKGVAKEFCAHVEVTRAEGVSSPAIRRMVAVNREAPRHEIEWNSVRLLGRKMKSLARVMKNLGVAPAAQILDGMPLEGGAS